MNGPRQTAIMGRIGSSGLVIPSDNAERCACWRLARRGVLRRLRFGTAATGYLRVYEVVR